MADGKGLSHIAMRQRETDTVSLREQMSKLLLDLDNCDLSRLIDPTAKEGVLCHESLDALESVLQLALYHVDAAIDARWH